MIPERPSLSILTIGNEILDGRILDSNSQHLCERLASEGFLVCHTLSANDELSDICGALEFLGKRSSAIIISGGLGPTSDDLTRESVAEFAGVRLEQNDEVLRRLVERYKQKGRNFDPSNAKQAIFPETSRVIPNEYGTAAGFDITVGQVRIFSLPGIPKELKGMFEDYVLPQLEESFSSRPLMRYRTLRLFGLPESLVGRLVSELLGDDPLQVSYRASFPIVTVRLGTLDAGYDLEEAEAKVASVLGADHVFAKDPFCNLPETVFELLRSKSLTLALAESCTGGMLGSLLTSFAGSSEVLLGGCISYSNAVKVSELGVRDETLERFGAVSHETAREMAKGIGTRLKSDIAISITGVAGPGGGSAYKPVGTFYVGLAHGSRVSSFKFFFSGTRAQVRRFACFCALDQVRRHVLGFRLLGEQGL